MTPIKRLAQPRDALAPAAGTRRGPDVTLDRSQLVDLLTTAAEPFFTRHGYRAANRQTAPEAIRRTREFAGLCPASAAYLTKDL